MNIIDSHAHLDQLEDPYRELENAFALGVRAVITMGVDLLSNQRNIKIQKKAQHPPVFLALGLHPGNIKTEEIEENLGFISRHASEAVAIGEIGLDYWYKWVRKDEIKKKEQQEVFSRQLKIALESDLPVVIHSRGAWKDCLRLAREAGIKKANFHWYSGPIKYLEEILSSGYYISAGPALAYSQPLQEAVRYAPLERILLETDTPVFYRTSPEAGFQAVPKDVWKTLDLISSVLGRPQEELAEIFFNNTLAFFEISLSPQNLSQTSKSQKIKE